MQEAIAAGERSLEETVEALAAATCDASPTRSANYVVGTALAGSEEKATDFQDLLHPCVWMCAPVPWPHGAMSLAGLERHRIGLVGASEAFSAALKLPMSRARLAPGS